MHKRRTTATQKKIQTLGIDALFITSPYNISYLTGIVPSSIEEREFYIFLTQEKAYILASKMFILAIKEQTTDFSYREITPHKNLYQQLTEIVNKERIRKIGFEERNLLYKEFELLQKSFQNKTQLIPTDDLIEEYRQIKDEYEIEQIKIACKITDACFGEILKNTREGVTEQELASEIEYYLRKKGRIAFPPIVAFGKNSAVPHHIPTPEKLTPNSFVLFDFGAKYNGYCADMSRTIYFGTPTVKEAQIYNSVLNAQKDALEKLKKWKAKNFVVSDLQKVAERRLKKDNLPPFPHALGHGMGLEVHETPIISTYSDNLELTENMVITVEPATYIPEIGGVRIEDDVLLTKNEYEILTISEKELTILK